MTTDDKFLELAVNGRTDLILTGDKDLLVLNPFRGIPIVAPATFSQGRRADSTCCCVRADRVLCRVCLSAPHKAPIWQVWAS